MARAKKAKPAFVGCTPRHLPAEMQLAAARAAVEVNPANAPLSGLLPLMSVALAGGPPPVLTPAHLAFVTNRYWGAGGADLSVSFLDSPTPAFREKWLAHANAWQTECRANVRFRWSQSGGQVRVAREPGSGYWSYVGTDITQVDGPTMNLDSFTEHTSESEWRRVVRHEVGHCLDGDTLVDCPRDLEKYPQGVPIRDLAGQQPWVYAWSDGRIVVRRASRVWLSKRMIPTVRIRLGTGQGGKSTAVFLPPLELVGTPDHPVLLADGVTWRNLGDLKPGDRLCSLYRDKNGKRSRIRWTGSERVREHVFVCEQVYGSRPDSCHAHHRNERQMDQSPDNLEWKDEHAHHSDHSRGRPASEKQAAALIEANKSRVYTPEMRARMSAAQAGKRLSEETKAKMSAATKGRKQPPELAAKRTEAMRRFYANGGKSGMFGKKASEETKRKRSESMKATLARKRQAAATADNHTVVSVEPAGFRDVYDMTVPDADSFVANGVVVHNSLGAPHEHMRQALVARLDARKTIAYFRATQGWSADEVRQQVLTPLEERSLLGTPAADEDSIMCYQLPGEITRDGRPIKGGLDFSASDRAFAAKTYPLAAPGGQARTIVVSGDNVMVTVDGRQV